VKKSGSSTLKSELPLKVSRVVSAGQNTNAPSEEQATTMTPTAGGQSKVLMLTGARFKVNNNF